jgi:AcrR family transcriptional regulator
MPRKAKFTKEDILDTALELVRKGGWAGLSVNAVAEKLGCSSMPIYSHFKNMEKLQDAVVIEGWELVKEFEKQTFTGDVWVDQAVGYVLFAKQEKVLFRCLIDSRNLEIYRKTLLSHWGSLTSQLTDYEPFKDLSEEQRQQIRYTRSKLALGLAITVSTEHGGMINSKRLITSYLKMASHAILEGFRDAPPLDEESKLELKDNLRKIRQG